MLTCGERNQSARSRILCCVVMTERDSDGVGDVVQSVRWMLWPGEPRNHPRAEILGVGIGCCATIKGVTQDAHVKGCVVSNKRPRDSGPQGRPEVRESRSVSNIGRGNAVDGHVKGIENQRLRPDQLAHVPSDLSVLHDNETDSADRSPVGTRRLKVYGRESHHSLETERPACSARFTAYGPRRGVRPAWARS